MGEFFDDFQGRGGVHSGWKPRPDAGLVDGLRSKE